MTRPLLAILLLILLLPSRAFSELANIKVVTDASPDYSDMESMTRSITSNWKTDQEKMWALFYWTHIARRYTYSPMHYHGIESVDPIRQYNDFGFTNMGTIAGINCAVWNYMGYPSRFYGGISEVSYAGKFHAYDSNFSCLYALPDGKTIAAVADIAQPGAGPETNGKTVPAYIARFHALNGTSPDGFLEGADCDRTLASRAEAFGGQYSYNYYNQERAHRYILNLRDGETYTRYYSRQDTRAPHAVTWSPNTSAFKSDPAYFVPNGLDELGNRSDPEALYASNRVRGNGDRIYVPILDETHLSSALHSSTNIKPVSAAGVPPASGGGGLQPAAPDRPATAIFKVEGANIITSLKLRALFNLASADDAASLAVSTTNGLQWKEIWTSAAGPDSPNLGEIPVDLRLLDEVSGTYEVLIKVTLSARKDPDNARLKLISFDTTTQINAKTQPQLRIGLNTVYVGLGEQSRSIVISPDLHHQRYAPFLSEEKNIRALPHDLSSQGMGVLFPEKPADEAFVIFKVDAPTDITSFTYGGRLSNRNPKSHIDFLHSFDNGKTWHKDYSLTDASMPSDTIHFERITDVPAGNRSVLLKYSMNTVPEDPNGCSLYSVHMEVNHRMIAPPKGPLEVTFNWSERQKDYSLVPRSHTQLVEKFPTTYPIIVNGADHPIVESLTINLRDATVRERDVAYGYSDAKPPAASAPASAPAPAEKWIGNWATYGHNLAFHKPYTLSQPSGNFWDSGDPQLKKLTDGVVGSAFSMGGNFLPAAAWNSNVNPEITVDLGEVQKCAAFRIHTLGWDPWDAVKGQNKDRIEVLTSTDGKSYTSAGFFNCLLRWKDIPVNYMFRDDEVISAYNFTLPLAAPVEARYIKYKIRSHRIFGVSEVQVLDSYSVAPFDLKIALPDPAQNGKPPAKPDLSPAAKPAKP